MKMARIVVLALLTILLADGPAFAQERGGFTALVDLGVGVQHDTSIEETAVGLAGLNVGAGAFLTRNLALMFRLAATNVSYDFGPAGDYRQVSGIVGPALQYWVSDRFNVEAGAGFGFWSAGSDEDETGLGLLLGAGVTVFNRGRHNLQFGIQYVPAFTDPGAVHNVGFTLGYQFL